MSKPTNLAPKQISSSERFAAVGTAPAETDLGPAVSVTAQLFETTGEITEESPRLEILIEDAAALEDASRLADHLFGEEGAATPAPQRTVRAAARLGGEELVDHVFEDLSGPPSRFGLTSAVVGAANDAFDPRTNARLVTQIAAEIQPSAAVDGAVALAVDTAAVIGRDDAIPALDRINQNALGGEYGAPTQTVSMVSNLVVDPRATNNALTGQAAEEGEYGVFVRFGNDLANGVFEAQHSRYESEWAFRADQ